jgi:hypothetical protein
MAKQAGGTARRWGGRETGPEPTSSNAGVLLDADQFGVFLGGFDGPDRLADRLRLVEA